MIKVITTKKHLLVKRAKIMKFLVSEGYSGTDIASIFNIDKSGVSRILAAEERYKKSVRNLLADKS